MLLHGTGVRGGLRVNAFRQLHLNIKSNLPPPFCSGAFAERDELCQCAPGEGKGADEAHRVAWEHAGMVQGTDLRTTSAPFLKILVKSEASCTLPPGPPTSQPSIKPSKRVCMWLMFHVPMFWPDLWCAFSIMPGGHLETSALPPCICLRDEAGVHPTRPIVSVSTSAIADRDEERSVNPAGWTATEGAVASERRRWPPPLKSWREGVCPGKKWR